jgi:hypothetical protein
MLDQIFKQKIVEKLILQYSLYVELSENIKSDKFELLKLEDENLSHKKERQIKNKEVLLERFGDEMSFPLPSVWILYKNLAYKNTNNPILTVADFVEHCKPGGHICSQRFIFLTSNLSADFWSKSGEDLHNYANHPEIVKLENDPNFMETWLLNEFKIVNNKISKWKE